MQNSPLAANIKDDYLKNKVIPEFKLLLDKDIYSLIINRQHQIEICTNKSAQSVGLDNWEELAGVCFKEFEDKDKLANIFKESYSTTLKDEIDLYAKKLVTLQEVVFSTCKIVQFIDMLPYNNQFLTYITTYTPIISPDGEVIAIQSFSIQSYVLRFQGHLSPPNDVLKPDEFNNFTNRELEILFLLSNGATQDQIAQILNISRGTIAAVVSNQLCPKFKIAGANTRLLTESAIKAGMYKHMPQSLWRPCLIVLNYDLLGIFSGDK